MNAVRTVAAAVAAALVVVATTACGGGGAATTGEGGRQVVHVGTVPLALFGPLYVAEAKGYFADEGIELDTQTVSSGQDAIPLVSNGQLDVLIAGFSAGMFNAVHAGLDVKVVGSMNVGDADPKNPAAALVVSSKVAKQVPSVAALKGRKVALAGGVGGSGAYFTGLVLAQAGLSLKDVKVENLANPDMPAALKSGAVDAAFTSAPFNTNAVKDGSARQLAVAPDGASGTGVIYGGKFVSSKLAQPFFDALAHGAKDLQGDGVRNERNLGIIAKATQQDVATLKASPLFRWLPDLAPQPKALTDMERIWRGVGALTYREPLRQSTFVDDRFSRRVR